MQQQWRVRYMKEESAEKIFYSKEAADKFAAELKAQGKRYLLDERPELKPMLGHESITFPQYEKLAVELSCRNHFLRSISFARSNGLEKELGKSFLDLMGLLATRSEARIYADGYTDPGFGWQGAGMVGGLIFHPSTRDWSIHT